jgi:alkylmercury lyase
LSCEQRPLQTGGHADSQKSGSPATSRDAKHSVLLLRSTGVRRSLLRFGPSSARLQPVPRTTLAKRLETSVEAVNRILDSWPGVFSDAEGRIVGYWGVSIPAAYSSPHTLRMNGRTLSAWCAWDTLFLPQLVGHTAEVESASPQDGGIVRLTITPQQVERVQPVAARMSVLVPDAQEMQKNVVTSFCHFVHFFSSPQAGESWTAKHAGIFLLSVHEAHVLACLKNEAQYRDALR